jgi:hypothetical protein
MISFIEVVEVKRGGGEWECRAGGGGKYLETKAGLKRERKKFFSY